MTTTNKDITNLLDEKCISYRDSELQRLLEKLDYDDLSLLHYLFTEVDGRPEAYERGYDNGDYDGYERGWQEGYDQALREEEEG